jgi:hypothetical protein
MLTASRRNAIHSDDGVDHFEQKLVRSELGHFKCKMCQLSKPQTPRLYGTPLDGDNEETELIVLHEEWRMNAISGSESRTSGRFPPTGRRIEPRFSRRCFSVELDDCPETLHELLDGGVTEPPAHSIRRRS